MKVEHDSQMMHMNTRIQHVCLADVVAAYEVSTGMLLKVRHTGIALCGVV